MPTNLLEPEFEPHYSTWKAQEDPKTTAALLTAIAPVLDNAVKTYGGPRPGPNVKTKAKLIALDATRRYDPSRSKLRTHLMTHLQGLHRVAAREAQIISLPERIGLDAFHLQRAESDLQDKLGRSPSMAEISDHTGLSLKRIKHLQRPRSVMAEGSMMSQSDEGPVQFNPAVENDDDSAWRQFVYDDLHPSDQLIMEHTTGMHGRKILPKQEIARKLGISPGALSQRAAKIQAMIDRSDELNPFM